MSLGIESEEAVPADGSIRMILMVSLRWPPALSALPKWRASVGVSPARLSEPITSTL